MNRTLLEKELQKADNVLPIPLAKSAAPQALVINLGSESESIVDIPQNYLNKYVGGPALAARLWACYVDLPEDNPIVITGDNSGSLICVAFKSPVTGELCFNTFSGRFSIDYCAVIVIGSLHKTGVVDYSGNVLRFNFDSRLKSISIANMSEFYQGCITTGLAADNELFYSCAVCNNNISGRGGLGYVMNAKKLKAINIGILPTVRDTYDFSSFVKNANVQGWAPVDNISKRTDPRLFHLSASEKTRKLGDAYIPCQAILMLGSNVGCFDIASVNQRYQLCLDYGIDPVSLGNILGWIRETQERGIVVLPTAVDFANNDQVLNLIRCIVERRDGYEIFAEGVKSASLYYHNKKYDRSINGLECGPYDYRGSLASAINEAIGNWFPVYFDLIPDIAIKNKSELAVYNEELVMGLQCLNINPDVVVPRMINKLTWLQRHLISKNLLNYERVLDIEGLNITDAFTVGQNCRYLVRKINKILKGNKPGIPDFFCVDPNSNMNDDTIVDIRKLLAEYEESIRKIYLANGL